MVCDSFLRNWLFQKRQKFQSFKVHRKVAGIKFLGSPNIHWVHLEYTLIYNSLMVDCEFWVGHRESSISQLQFGSVDTKLLKLLMLTKY